MRVTTCDACDKQIKKPGDYSSITGNNVANSRERNTMIEDWDFKVDLCKTCIDKVDEKDIIECINGKYYMENNKKGKQDAK